MPSFVAREKAEAKAAKAAKAKSGGGKKLLKKARNWDMQDLPEDGAWEKFLDAVFVEEDKDAWWGEDGDWVADKDTYEFFGDGFMFDELWDREM